MKLCVIGTGYVGLVTGACFANLGNEVICVDKDRGRLRSLKKSVVPFYEPGLEALVVKNLAAKRIRFSTDLEDGVRRSEVIFIAVGTPSKESGEADISSVIEVAKKIAAALRKHSSRKGFKVIVNKSTVPVGMGDVVTKILIERGVSPKNFAVVSNPEFLREGSALADFMHPDRIVIGAATGRAFNVITELYRPLNAHIIFTSVKSAELIKYASNAFLATKISFINEIANICERTGSDVVEVADAIGLDKRIGRKFLNAGLGYGGSCLPKDVMALIHLAAESGYETMVLNSVNDLNQYQIEAFIGKIFKALKKTKGKQITMLGLSFKPETDDLREAPSLKIVERLREKGVKVRVYDPAYKNRSVPGLDLYRDIYAALKGSDAMVLVTDWPEFRELDFERVKNIMKGNHIFDGRNIYEPKRMKDLGFIYAGVGR